MSFNSIFVLEFIYNLKDMSTKLITIGKYTSIAIIALGAIHIVATFTPLIQEGLECLSKGNLHPIIYMSLICGGALILSGLLIVMLLKKLEQAHFLYYPILTLSFFIFVDGVLSVVYMYDNPFAWLVLLFGLFIVVLSLKIARIYKRK